MVRKVLAIALLALSGCLLWYSISAYKLSGQNSPGDFSARFFPEAQTLNGHSRYLALDPAGAAEFYRRAIFEGPSFLDAWIGLARACIAEGRINESRKILKIIAPTLTSISTWKWQELLLAYDLPDEKYFEQCLNFILAYLPHHVREAGILASRFWGRWEEVIPHVLPCNRLVFLNTLIDQKQADAAVALFKLIENEGPQLNEKDQLELCNFLIATYRLKEAKTVWRFLKKEDAPLIDDGSFEKAPLDTAFGWRFKDDPNVLLERKTGSPCPGSSCLHVHFKGSGNFGSDLVYQVVPVMPETSYCLSFVRKSSNLTTDSGVFLSVVGFNKDRPRIASEPVLGDSPWKEEKIEFTVPAGCEAVFLYVRRNESLKMDSKISGDYWLGSMQLRALGPPAELHHSNGGGR